MLICRKGLVVRVPDESGAAKNYLYRLGKSFEDRQELTRATHPVIWQTLERESEEWPHGGSTVPQRS